MWGSDASTVAPDPRIVPEPHRSQDTPPTTTAVSPQPVAAHGDSALLAGLLQRGQLVVGQCDRSMRWPGALDVDTPPPIDRGTEAYLIYWMREPGRPRGQPGLLGPRSARPPSRCGASCRVRRSGTVIVPVQSPPLDLSAQHRPAIASRPREASPGTGEQPGGVSLRCPPAGQGRKRGLHRRGCHHDRSSSLTRAVPGGPAAPRRGRWILEPEPGSGWLPATRGGRLPPTCHGSAFPVGHARIGHHVRTLRTH